MTLRQHVGPTVPGGRAAGGRVALFLDFDGTLVEIAPRPDAVRVRPDLPDLLERLRARCGGALAIVTGRPIADVDAFLPGLGLDVCGLHGLERRVGGLHPDRVPLADLRPEAARLRDELAAFPGVIIEDKTVGVAVHWRLQPEAEGAARNAVDAILARLGPSHRAQDGKAVREVVPAVAGKGAAIRALMARPPYLGRLPVFAGDDRTDEDGFAAVEGLGGTGIKVGPGGTGAARRIASVSALADTFARWLADGSDPFGWGDAAAGRPG